VPAEGVLLEIPAGGLDVHEDGTKEEPALAARRELEEETGLRAGRWEKLAEFYSAPGFTDELMHLYLATDLTPADPDGRLGPDSDEQLILEWLPFGEAVGAVERGEIRDAKSIVGLLWLERRRHEDAEPASVPEPAEAPETAEAPEPAGAAGPDPSGDTVTVRYRLDRSLVIHAGLVMGRRSFGSRILGIGLIALAVVPPLFLGWDLAVLIAGLPLVVLGILFLTGWFYAPIMWYLMRKRPDLMNADTTVVFSENGLDMHAPTSTGHVTWSTFQRVTESDRMFFLDIGTGNIMLLPKAPFSPTQLGVFYRLLERHRLLPKR
jgi:8-oxo-dGTP pyrophosphatase MutT (NUDIX family)